MARKDAQRRLVVVEVWLLVAQLLACLPVEGVWVLPGLIHRAEASSRLLAQQSVPQEVAVAAVGDRRLVST